jgi:hypothetical protein
VAMVAMADMAMEVVVTAEVTVLQPGGRAEHAAPAGATVEW